MLDVGATSYSAGAGTVGLVLNGTAGGAGTASQGILFGGNGVAHGNLAYLPNEKQFIFRTGNNPTDVTDSYGAAGLSILGKVGIGTAAPNSKFQVSAGDGYFDTIGNGVILRSPDGSCYRVTVANGGGLVTTAIVCP